MAFWLIALLLGLALGPGILAKSSVESLRKGKREGKLVWGIERKIPNVTGASWQLFNEADKKGKPLSAGVKFTPAFLQSVGKLPCFFLQEPGFEKSCATVNFENFPSKSSPFAFMELDFTTGGHAPMGIYNKAHFDIHFYLIDTATLNNTLNPATNGGPCPPVFNPATFAKLHRPIPTACYPKGFSNIPGLAVPLMGNHLVNLNAKEFKKPGSFDATFLYGTFDGEITFFEPMLTQKFLLKKQKFCGPIPSLPAEFPKAGWYPSTYCIYTAVSGDVYVELRDYIWKKAGCLNPKAYGGYLQMPPEVKLPAECKYEKPPTGK